MATKLKCPLCSRGAPVPLVRQSQKIVHKDVVVLERAAGAVVVSCQTHGLTRHETRSLSADEKRGLAVRGEEA